MKLALNILLLALLMFSDLKAVHPETNKTRAFFAVCKPSLDNDVSPPFPLGFAPLDTYEFVYLIFDVSKNMGRQFGVYSEVEGPRLIDNLVIHKQVGFVNIKINDMGCEKCNGAVAPMLARDEIRHFLNMPFFLIEYDERPSISLLEKYAKPCQISYEEYISYQNKLSETK
jgi:hypothetical protein